MPKYRNTGSEAITVPSAAQPVAAGAVVTTREYLYPKPEDLTLIEEAKKESTGKKIYSGSTLPTASLNVLIWDYVEVYNGTDDEITIQANNDTTNTWLRPAGSITTFRNYDPKEWRTIKISGSGTGNVQITGYPKN